MIRQNQVEMEGVGRFFYLVRVFGGEELGAQRTLLAYGHNRSPRTNADLNMAFGQNKPNMDLFLGRCPRLR